MNFVCVALYKEGVSDHCLRQINKLYPSGNIFIICPEPDIAKFRSLFLKNCTIINEDTVIDNVDRSDFLQIMNFELKENRDRKTWYWQQFLKLLCFNHKDIPEQYIIIDSDFILLKEISFVLNDKVVFNKSLVPTGREYDLFIQKSVGVANVENGYISEYMVFDTVYLKEMLSFFGDTSPDIVKNCLKVLQHNGYDLGEYLWYANFMFHNYPNKVTTQKIFYNRLAHHYYGDSIRDCDLKVFEKIWALDAISIEPWPSHFIYGKIFHKWISKLRYSAGYYGWLPFSVKPKSDPSWVYRTRYPKLWAILKFLYNIVKNKVN